MECRKANNRPRARFHSETGREREERRSSEKPNKTQQNPTKANESPKDKDKDYKETLPNGSAKKAATASFTPPSVEDVRKYCTERGNSVNASAFVDYYAARGWCLTNGVKVKDWRACVRTWENRDKERGKVPTERITARADRYSGENYTQKVVRMNELTNIIFGGEQNDADGTRA